MWESYFTSNFNMAKMTIFSMDLMLLSNKIGRVMSTMTFRQSYHNHSSQSGRKICLFFHLIFFERQKNEFGLFYIESRLEQMQLYC